MISSLNNGYVYQLTSTSNELVAQMTLVLMRSFLELVVIFLKFIEKAPSWHDIYHEYTHASESLSAFPLLTYMLIDLNYLLIVKSRSRIDSSSMYLYFFFSATPVVP